MKAINKRRRSSAHNNKVDLSPTHVHEGRNGEKKANGESWVLDGTNNEMERELKAYMQVRSREEKCYEAG